MDRVIVFSHEDEFLFELSESDVYELRRHEEINGEHYLTITTTTVLQKEQRILTQDATGKWYEWVVTTEDMEHAGGTYMVGTYMAVWSLQHDLSTIPVSVMVGLVTPVGAEQALTALLSTTDRWGVGTVTVTKTGGASMYRTLVWGGLATLISVWGGEVDAEITVDGTKVTGRAVSLWSHQGSSEATRRFDYGADLVGIRRRVESDPFACRIIPLGKGEESEGGGYGRKITIEDVNDGKDYLQNDDVVAYVRVPTAGGYEYPTIYAENPEIETPLELKAWGESVLEELTSPKVSYEADVLQLSQAGMDVYGIALGDLVHCVDRKFSPEGLRVAGRVTGIDANLLDPSDTQVTIGYLSKSLSAAMQESLAQLDSRIDATIASTEGAAELTDAYVARIISRLNEEANLTGGYFYYVVGQGVRTYDTAVSDPTVGSEASQVVEIRGGNIRIANSRTSSGDWDWKTVIVSGHLAIDLVTAARLVAGYIGSPSGNYWNLDTGEFRMAATNVTVDGDTLADYIGDSVDDATSGLLTQQAVFNALTNNGTIQGLYMSNGQLYVNASYIQGGVLRAGGAGDVNGIVQVLDASGNVVVDLSKDGAVLSHPMAIRGSGTYNRRSVMEVSEIETTSDRLWTVLTHTSTGYTGAYHIPAVTISGTEADMSTEYSHVYIVPRIFNHSTYAGYYVSTLYSDAPLQIMGGFDLSASDSNVPTVYAGSQYAAVMYGSTAWIPTTSNPVSYYNNGLYALSDKVLICGDTVAIHGAPTSAPHAFILDSTNTLTIGNIGAHNVTTNHTGPVTITGTLTVSGTKSRVADTKDYGNRLLYCDETPAPTFTDFGSGTIGEDGLCYVEIDDMFSETARTDLSYQVFLQKCGRGDLWVSEKHPNHFVVKGDPNLRFDWQLKARQTGYENIRMEDFDFVKSVTDVNSLSPALALASEYDEDVRYAELIESLYVEELA